MGPVGKKSGQLQAAINVTPLVDVVLVLLIIFMVVTPMLAQGDKVELPKAVLAQATPSAESSVILTIDSHEQLSVRGEKVREEQLVERLKRAGKGPKPRVLLKADGNVPATTVRKVLKLMKAGGLDQIAFAVIEKRAAP